jgi:hypothetical protein
VVSAITNTKILNFKALWLLPALYAFKTNSMQRNPSSKLHAYPWFITVFTTARHLYHILSQINPVHAIPTDLSSILILPPSMPTSSKWLLSLTFPTENLNALPSAPCLHVTPVLFSLFHDPDNTLYKQITI